MAGSVNKVIIDNLRDRYPDLYEQVADAYEMRKNEITDDAAKAQGMAAE
jgi:hypothetical protein